MSIFGSPAKASGGARSANNPQTASFATAIGDLIIVFAGWSDSGTVTDVVDTAGNTYVPGTQRGPLAEGVFAQFWYCLGATHASATNKVTVTYSNAANNNAIVFVEDVPLTGGTADFDLDVTSDGGGDATTAAYDTTGDDEYVMAVAYDQFGTGGYVAGAGYTLDSASFDIPSGAPFGGTEHIVFASPQTGIASSFSTHPGVSAAIAIAFKAGSAPPPPSGGAGKTNVMTTQIFGARIITPTGSIFGTGTRTRIN